jgi:toxin ParE1/3/4
MGVYRLSEKAEEDLAAMYEYGILKFGLAEAQWYFFAIHETFQLLSARTDLGLDASEFIQDLRKFTFKVHTIFYFAAVSGIFIVRVLSQHMDYMRNLNL